mgnify:FL=1
MIVQSALFLDYGRLTLMDRERTDAVWKKYGRSLWNFAGSYGLGIALMLILLVLTFAGTLHQVRLSSAMGSEAAIESFFGAAYVLIPPRLIIQY